MIDNNKKQTDKFYAKVGKRICEIRNMRGFSRNEVAKMSGISSKFLYEIEKGKKGFSIINLQHLCMVLQVSPEYILNGKKEIVCDEKIVNTLQLFKQNHVESLNIILREIYKMSKIK